MSTQQIIRLTPRHNKILDYCIEGLQPKDIAEKLHMSPRQIGIIISSGSFQHQLAMRRQAFTEDHDQKLAEQEVTEAHSILQQHAAAAAKRLIAGMLSNSENISIRSAESILDRTGTVKITRQETSDKPIINISREDLQLLKETLELEKELRPREIVSTEVEEEKETSSDGLVDEHSSTSSFVEKVQ